MAPKTPKATGSARRKSTTTNDSRPSKKQKLNASTAVVNQNNKVNQGTQFPEQPKPSRMPENRLEKFPNEILSMVFQNLGTHPKDEFYEVKDLKETHPCYLLCSAYPRLKDVYEGCPKDVRGYSKKIELYIQPPMYLEAGVKAAKGADFVTEFKKALKPLGTYGLSLVKGIYIIGPKMSRDFGSPIITRYINGGLCKRLEPEHKVGVKTRVEEDIESKKVIINSLFEALATIFGSELETLRIYPGEMPANVWCEPLQKFVLTHGENLEKFELKTPERYPRSHRGHWPFVAKLTRGPFEHRENQPQNYPSCKWANWRLLDDLETAIRGVINTKARLKDLKITIR